MRMSRLTIAALLAGLVLSSSATAESAIEVNAAVSEELAPPAGVFDGDEEIGAPLARTDVSIAGALPGVWEYAATADITVPKLAILGAIDNSSGGPLAGPFGGEVPLMSVNATLRDTISITAPTVDPYIVTAELVVDGVLNVAGSDGRVIALMTISPIGQLSATQTRTYASSGIITDDTLPISFQFSGDAVFDLTSSLFFFVRFVDAGATVLADFSNTAIINLVITTVGGEPIPNVVITSESGNFGSAPVPVPAALPLLLSALAAVGWARRRA